MSGAERTLLTIIAFVPVYAFVGAWCEWLVTKFRAAPSPEPGT